MVSRIDFLSPAKRSYDYTQPDINNSQCAMNAVNNGPAFKFETC